MSAFAELPPGTVLPPLAEHVVADLQSAQDTGHLHLADGDEAELAAIGAPSFPRAGRSELTEADVEAGAGRLVGRGLAEQISWQLGRVRPAGGLLTYLQLALHPKAHVGMITTWFQPHVPGAEPTIRRVNLLIDVVHGGLACVENASAQRVAIDVLRLDLLVEAVVATAFGDDAAIGDDASLVDEAGSRETLVLFADGAGTQQPTRLRVSGMGTAELESSRHGLLGNRTVRDKTDRPGFAEHLRLRLMAAG